MNNTLFKRMAKQALKKRRTLVKINTKKLSFGIDPNNFSIIVIFHFSERFRV